MLSLLGPAEVSAHSVTWLGALLEVSSKGAITLVAAAVLALTLRRASAASRHLVWGWALICVLALPVLSFVLPAWRVAMLPQILSGTRSEQAVNASDPAPVSLGHEAQQSQESASLSADIDSVLSKKFQLSSPSVVEAEEMAPPPDEAFHTPSRAGLHWSVWILIIWLAGMFVVYLRLLIGIISVWRTARRATEISDSEWAGQACSLASHLRIGRPVRLLKSDRVSTPLTWGCLKSEVLLPSDAARWSADRRQVVLLHELAHVRRRDWLMQTIAQIVCAFYWFNPLVWVAARQLRAESERACDDHVLGIGTRPSDYAGHLLEIARSLSATKRSSPAAVTMARRSQLEGRLLAILNPALSRRRLGRIVSTLIGVALACVVLPLAAVRPLAQDNSRGPAAKEEALIDDESATFATAASLAFKNAPEVAKTSSRVPEKVEGTPQEATESIQMPEENQQTSEQVTEPRVQKDQAVVQGLVDALKDEDPQVRRQAAFALSKTDDARASEALIASLNDSDWQVRAQAVWALGLRPGQIPVERLIAALKDNVRQVRSQAAWSLGLKGDGSAVEALIEALKDEDAQVCSQAAWALGLKGDSRAIEPLIQALRDENRQVRSRAAWALGLKGDSRAVEPLLVALRDADRNVRAQAAWALGLKGDRRALRPLNDARKDEDGHVRKQASWALGMILMKLGDADDIELDLDISPVVRSDIKVNPRLREKPRVRVKSEANEVSTKPLD